MVYNFGRLVISAIRIRLAEQYKRSNDFEKYDKLKGSRFLLLARNANLTDEKKAKLDDILAYYRDLNCANELKELLPGVYKALSKEHSEQLWDEWVKLAYTSEVEEIVRFAKVQDRNYRDGITNSGIYHIGTSVLEGINNKIYVDPP